MAFSWSRISSAVSTYTVVGLSLAAVGVGAAAVSDLTVLMTLMTGVVALTAVDGSADDLERLVRAVERLADGDYDVSVEAAGDEDVGRLADAVDDLASTLRERERAERESETYRQRLYQITSDASLDDETKIRRLLELGCERLDMECGFISRIDESERQFEIRNLHGTDRVKEGAKVDLSQTYCRNTIESDDILGACDPSSMDERVTETWGISCYLGGKVTVGDNLYGTVCFVGWEPREEPFTPVEKAFVDLVVRWVSFLFETREHERQLERRKQYTDDILDAIDDVFYVIDENCAMQRWNETLCEVTGYSDAEIESMNAREFFVEEDRNAVERAIVRIDEVTGEYLEATVLTKNGERVPFELVAAPLEVPEGERVVAGIARDITERKERERELRETNERLGAIVDASPAALISSNLEGDVGLWNPAAERIFGWSPEEVRGERLPIVPDDRVDEFEELRERVVSGDIVTGLETRRQTKDGSLIDVSISAAPLHDSDGEVSGVVAAVEDISERKEQERELERSRNMLQQSQRLAQVGAWELDVSGVGDPELSWTDEVYRIHEMPTGADVDLDEAIEFYHPEDRQRVRDAVAGALERGEPYEFETRLITQEGNERWVQSIGRPVREDGEISRVRGSIQDITELKERERELERTRDLLTQAQRMTDVGAWELDVASGPPYVPEWSDEIYDLFGLSTDEELTSERVLNLFHPDDREQRRTAFERALETGEGWDQEARIVRETGDIRWVRSIGESVTEDGDLVKLRGSVQDITDQKERELALKSLHNLARNLLNTETESGVAELVTDAAGDILDVSGVAVYLLDTEGGRLDPAAFTDGFADVSGEATPVAVGDNDSAVSTAFVRRSQTTVDDGEATDGTGRLKAESGLLVPLGDHGVLVAVAESTTIDSETRRLVETLAATTEAAFDRLESEAALRERDAELREQNRRLRRQIGINDIIRTIDRTLIQADSQEAIEGTVCERLVGAQDIVFAWIGGIESGGDELVPRAWAGTDTEYLNAASLSRDDPAPEPSVATVLSGESTVVESVVDRLKSESWRKHALAADLHSVISVPLSVDEYDYGVLSVYADEPNAFGDLERTVFEELGRNIANSINAGKTRMALYADTLLELTLRLDAPDEFLSQVARETGGRVEYEGLGEQTPDRTQVFFETSGVDPDAVAAVLDDLVSVREYRRMNEATDRCRFGAVVTSDVLASKLVRRGGRPRSIRADPTELEVVVDMPPTTPVRELVETLEESYPSVELVARRDVQRAFQGRRDVMASLFEGLTDRQREVLRTAYYSGFFEWPRESTGEDIAEMLDVSQPTINRHLRIGQQRLLSQLLEKDGRATGEK